MPVGAKININIGKGGYLGAYLGMQNIAHMPRKKIEKYFYVIKNLYLCLELIINLL